MMLTKTAFRLLLLCFCISRALLSFSQSDTINLNEVSIYGVKPEISVITSTPVQNLSAKKLSALPTTSVAEAIRNFTGVAVKDFGGVGGLKTVMIRSLGSNHTGVFVDGFPVNDAATGQIDLGRISLNDISNITLSIGNIVGLKPARMSSPASLIEITTNDIESLNEKHRINIALRAGSFNTYNPWFSLDSRVSKNVTSAIKLSGFASKGNYPYQITNGSDKSTHKRSNSDVKNGEAEIKLKIQLKDSSFFKVKTSYLHSERGLPGAVVFYNPYSAQRLKSDDFTIGITYENKLKARFRHLTSGSIQSSKLLYTDPAFLNNSGGLKNEYNQQEYYLSQAAKIQLSPKVSLALATDGFINTLSTNAYQVTNPSRFTSLTSASGSYISPIGTLQGNVLLTITTDRHEANNRNFQHLAPEVSILSNLTKDKSLKLRLMLKNTFRMPTFNDMYYNISGNTNLKPEKANLYNAGLMYAKALNNRTGLNIRADFFINTVDDKIVTVPTRNLFIWSTRNIGKVNIKGLELYAGILKQVTDNLSFDISATYTYQDAKDVTNKLSHTYGHQIAYIPFETAGGLFTFFYKKYSLGLNTIYNGYRYSAPYNSPENEIPAYTTTDLTLARILKFSGHELNIKAEVSNLFDYEYEVVKGFPMTGRAFYINLNLSL